MTDIVDELEGHLGPEVEVLTRLDVSSECRLSPHDGVRWFFASRAK
jgi:hypothetical protein